MRQNQDRAVYATDTHLVVSMRAVLTLLTGAAVIGVALTVVGLLAAYAEVGTGTPAGTVITVAIAVAVAAVAGGVGHGWWLRRHPLHPAPARTTGDRS